MSNSRPLYPLSSVVNDFCALTPGHFLKLETPITVPQPDLGEVKVNQLQCWQLVERLNDYIRIFGASGIATTSTPSTADIQVVAKRTFT
ncbi:hypothetical protein PR048_018150 [Dryococelus australis]|uniref:Uncharacterized protein n=1 Tax=Dryococelus australis TaxID=614101 RepID=A0ABQ9HBL1_9NEOP|nr:hypothetical protein PR048_018150 [Dryococelus australis]